MSGSFHFSGILAPVVTPYGEDGAPDAGRFIDHCRWLMGEGCHGLVPFGTTSEANSLGLDERMELLEALVEGGIEARALMVGTGTSALPDTVTLTRHALDLDCGGVLVLPPFYYKAVTDEGLFRYFAALIDEVADARLKLYLYHFPKLAGIGFSPALVTRLVDAFPGIVVGLKESSGDWDNMSALLELKLPGFAMFPGSERFLLPALRLGAAGSINAYANLNAARQRRLYDNWQGSEAEALQDAISAFRQTMSDYPMIAAIKALVALARDEPRWGFVRPPLEPLAADEAQALAQVLRERHEFSMAVTIDV